MFPWTGLIYLLWVDNGKTWALSLSLSSHLSPNRPSPCKWPHQSPQKTLGNFEEHLLDIRIIGEVGGKNTLKDSFFMMLSQI